MLNNNNKKLLLFDYDGTLVDSAQMIINGTIEAFNRCGLATPEPEKIKAGIGNKWILLSKAIYLLDTKEY